MPLDGTLTSNSNLARPIIPPSVLLNFRRAAVTRFGLQVMVRASLAHSLVFNANVAISPELYDRFSKPYQKFLEGLTATFVGDGFIRAAAADPENVRIYKDIRGSPQNIGEELTAVHPVVRTNPVTGWKSIFSVGPFPKQINELNSEESDELLKKFYDMILQNHDLTVRFKWRSPNDLGEFTLSVYCPLVSNLPKAIWDNRSAFHSATFDYEGLGERFGNRAVGIGEAPYLDPNSKSRSEDLNVVRS